MSKKKAFLEILNKYKYNTFFDSEWDWCEIFKFVFDDDSYLIDINKVKAFKHIVRK